jgi:Cu/Ag efflux protein CusF
MRRKLLLICGVVGVCAFAGVATALATSGKTQHAHSGRAAAANSSQGGYAPPGGPGGPRGPGGFAVHAESVVLDKAGTEFITLITDSGTVKSVEASAGKLTITEAAKSVTYKTVTLSIPSAAKVALDGKSSSLESLKEGDRVTVSSSSEGTTVQAADSSFHPEGGGWQGGPPPAGQTPSSE